jgi:hypothetical protein
VHADLDPYGIAIIPLFLASGRAHELSDPQVWEDRPFKLPVTASLSEIERSVTRLPVPDPPKSPVSSSVVAG